MQGKMIEIFMNKRLKYTLITIILLTLEVIIALFIHDTIIRPYMGDVLVVVVLYTFIRIFLPEKYRLLPLYIFIFATFVEVLQYFHIVDLLGLSENRFFYILIGGTFDWKDIICYGTGCVLLFVFWKVRNENNDN